MEKIHNSKNYESKKGESIKLIIDAIRSKLDNNEEIKKSLVNKKKNRKKFFGSLSTKDLRNVSLGLDIL